MATSLPISLLEYRLTSFETDCDYVDGEIQERNCGTREHSDLLGQLVELLATPENKAHVRVNVILRVQVSATRIRVADVCVRWPMAHREQIIRTPPLLCIEVLSPEDTVVRIRAKVRDLLEMGVLEVWVVDPASRSVGVCSGPTTVEHTAGELAVPETPVVLALADIFKVLDEY